MTRYFDFTPLAEIGNILISISATYILIAGAVTAVRFHRAIARRLPARTHNGRSASPPDVDRPYFFMDTVSMDWPPR